MCSTGQESLLPQVQDTCKHNCAAFRSREVSGAMLPRALAPNDNQNSKYKPCAAASFCTSQSTGLAAADHLADVHGEKYGLKARSKNKQNKHYASDSTSMLSMYSPTLGTLPRRGRIGEPLAA